MNLNELIEQHNKCVQILELIKTNECYLQNTQYQYDSAMRMREAIRNIYRPFFNQEGYLKDIATKKAITERLKQYYTNQLSKLKAS